ncbi:MAG: MraY family glycosyltransferase [Elusimicrobiales bacterium]
MTRDTKIFTIAWLALLLTTLPPGGISAWTWLTGLRWLYVAGIAFLFAGLLLPAAEWSARRLGAIDMPAPRKIHAAPTPRLGGLAVFAAFMFALWRSQYFTGRGWSIAAAGTLVFLLSAADDARGLSAYARLAGQAAASLIVVCSGMGFNFPGTTPAGRAVSCAFTVVWIIGITNAFNFLDGIDGLASGLGMVCSLFFIIVAWGTNQMELAFMSAALFGACAGFMRVNWHPASMFLGDCGSAFIGFMLACFAVYGGWATDNPLVAFGTPLLILGVPIFDLIYITAARMRRGDVKTVRQWLEFVGRDHFHHRLIHLGMTVPQAASFIIIVNVMLGLGAWTMHYTGTSLGTVLLVAQSALIFGVIAVLMILGRNTGETAAHPKGIAAGDCH